MDRPADARLAHVRWVGRMVMTPLTDAQVEAGLPSWEVMDDVARRLGAPDARAFLAAAPASMKACFRLCCTLVAKYEPPA